MVHPRRNGKNSLVIYQLSAFPVPIGAVFPAPKT